MAQPDGLVNLGSEKSADTRLIRQLVCKGMDQKLFERNRPIPCSSGRHEEETDVADHARRKGRSDLIRKNIAYRVVIMEISQRLHFKRWPVESCRESDLASKLP
jgi:hypothetical protein